MSFASKICCFLAQAVMGGCCVALGQLHDVRFERLSIEEGLSQASVYAILQDRYGFVWLGTQDGLNRFDGQDITVFKHTQFDSTSLVDNNVRDLAEDHLGDIWIGTRNGLSRFHLATETFKSYQKDTTAEGSISDNEIQAIYQDRSQRLWIGTSNGGLNLFQPEQQRFASFQHNPAKPNSLSHNRIRDILQGKNGEIWVATLGGGLNRFDPATGHFLHIRSGKGAATGLSSDYVMCLFQDPGEPSRIWVGTYGGGLNLLDTETNRVERVNVTVPDNRSRQRVFDICADPAGGIWFGTFSDGLIRFDPATGTLTQYLSEALNPESLSANFVRSLYLDRSQNLWIGTNLAGANRLDTKPAKFTRYRHRSYNDAGLRQDYVNAIATTPDGAVWVGTNAGLDMLADDATFFQHIDLDPAIKRLFVSALAYTPDGTLWVGSFGAGLFAYRLKSGTIERFGKGEHGSGLLDSRITTLLAAEGENLWVGTPSGLNLFDRTGKSWSAFTHDPEDAGTLSENAVQCLLMDRQGILWVGTNGGGLNRLEKETGEFQHFVQTNDPETGLSHNSVNSLLEDAAGNIWVGTNDGLSCLHRNGSIENYFEKDGLANAHICGILNDDVGNLWLSTPNGLIRFSRNRPGLTRFRTYGRADGLQGQSFLVKAAFRAPSGELFFGGTRGLVRFDPLRVQDNPYSPAIVMTSFKVFGKEAPLDTAISSVKQIQLTHDQHFFSFEFAALDYTEPSQNRYAYKMEGLDDEWHESGHRRYASYTHVPPGRYRFRVKASNNDGVWNEAGISVDLIITPPYWQRWWFRLLAVAAFISLLLVAHRLRVNKLLQIERTRNRIAQDLHDNVGATLSSISYFAQAIKEESPPEARSVVHKFLGLITESAGEAQEAISDIIWSIDPANDRWDKVLAKVRRYASDVLESRAITYRIDLPDRLPGRLDMERRRNLWLILKELLNNLVRHSNCTRAEIKLDAHNGHLHLTVADNGGGFDPDAKTGGNGLRNIRQRASALQGKLSLESTPGEGTRWSLIFPA